MFWIFNLVCSVICSRFGIGGSSGLSTIVWVASAVRSSSADIYLPKQPDGGGVAFTGDFFTHSGSGTFVCTSDEQHEGSLRCPQFGESTNEFLGAGDGTRLVHSRILDLIRLLL